MHGSIPDLTAGADLPRGFPRPFPVRRDGRRSVRYEVTARLCRAGIRALCGRQLHIEGLENVPRDGGPLLIVSNHLSNIDPMLVGGFTPGANATMAKIELYRNPAVAWLFGGVNALPVDRGAADRWALKAAMTILGHGGRFILWVEGTRAERPGMNRAEAGVGFLLRRRPCPILPVAVTGTEAVMVRGRRLPARVPVTLRFGPPVTLEPSPGREDNQAVADRVGALIASLLPPAYRGYYAEHAAAILGGAPP